MAVPSRPWKPALQWALSERGLTVALACLATFPLWSAFYLPLLDLPQHLSAVATIMNFDVAEARYPQYYELALGSTQYLLPYLITGVLSLVMPVWTALKITLSLYTVLGVVGFRALYRAVGEDPRVGLLWCAPLLYNVFFFLGFLNFVFAVPFFFLGLALLERALRDDRASDWAWLVGLSLAMFYSHVQIYLLYLGAVGLRALFTLPRWRRALKVSAHLAPTLLLFLIWVVRSGILVTGDDWYAANQGRNIHSDAFVWEPLQQRIVGLLEHVYAGYSDAVDPIMIAGMGLAALLILVFGGRDDEGERGRRLLPVRVLALCVVALCLLTPTNYKWIWPINWRFTPLAAAFIPLLLPRVRARGASLGVLILLGALNLFWFGVHLQRFAGFDEQVGEFDEVIEYMEPGKRVIGLIQDKTDPPFLHAVYLHFAQYYQALRGGAASFSHANFPHSPLRFQPDTAPPRWPLRFEWDTRLFDPKQHADAFDYYLVRAEFDRNTFAEASDRVQLVLRKGNWWLYAHR